MTRKSKPARRRARYPRKRIPVALKVKSHDAVDHIKLKPAINALPEQMRSMAFVPKFFTNRAKPS